MIKQKAIDLLNETFNNDFNNDKFFKFIKELFNEFSINQKDCTRYISKEYSEYMNSFLKIGDYKDNSSKEIEVLIVKLNKTSSRDRARTMQRNFIASWLGKTEKDAALVAFYGDDPKDWRFSFVKMEYNLIKDEKGKTKISKELTPAKRYSFLVGVNEPNHTCASQFTDLIIKEDKNPSLEEIEYAFSIEKVTKEFFDRYKDLFLKLEESLEKIVKRDEFVKDEFEDRGIQVIDFTKKLLGQIVFLYFLQKKGWLGVDIKGNWGEGPKDFMRRLFGNKERGLKPLMPYKNFFNEILEPLFYDALATDRSADDHYYRLFKCKIPFLNGGLFEPINEYNWSKTDILLDNDIFEEIFKTFDRFNFTVKEDEPLEKEVAVDPEMLGKVFENLLEIKDRKSKGAFYTPREIVHYMCQQSLINYLETNTSISKEDLEKFIQLGDFALDVIIKEQEQIKKYGKSYVEDKFTIPKSVREKHKEIDRLLKEIKIVDPAVGSGAFPVGMMNEIVKARSILSIYFEENRKDYDLKREIIENCLYGVDIEPSAVEITKLRFWLSLIVDELDMKNINPLPNLDHKIMCGNSLLEEFEGVKLFDEKLLGETKKDNSLELKQINDEIAKLWKEKGQLITGKSNGDIKEIDKEIKLLERKKKKIESDSRDTSRNMTLDEASESRIKESQNKLSELKRLQKEYFNEQNRNTKKKLREEINRIEWELIEETLKEQNNKEAIKKLEQYKKDKAKPFFLWKLYFAEVFQRENPGFDVVIANPPYGIVKETNTPIKELNSYLNYFCADFKINLFALFIEKAIQLSRKNGFISYIIPDSSLNLPAFKKLRECIMTESSLKNVSYYNETVFESAAIGKSIILFMEKNKAGDSYIFRVFDTKNSYKDTKIYYSEVLKDENLKFTYNFKNDAENSLFHKLKGISSKLDTFCDVYDGINPGSEFIKNSFISKSYVNSFSKKIIDGKNFEKYSKIKWDNNYIRYDEQYVEQIRNELKKKNIPFTARIIKKIDFFKNKKIVTRQTADTIIGTFDYDGYYVKNSVHSTLIKKKYIDIIDPSYVLGILNSKVIDWFYRKESSESGRLFPQVKISRLNNLPIKQISQDKQKQTPIINIVDQILSITKDDDYLENPDKKSKVKRLEKEIDQLVYTLYELTPEEVKIVEEFNDE